MNSQSEALRKCAHFLRSLRAQSNSPARFADEEPAAAEALATVEAALADQPRPHFELERLADGLTDEQADVAGALLAEALHCRQSSDFPDRWRTEWGTKTNRGLARTVLHVIASSIDPDARGLKAPEALAPAAVIEQREALLGACRDILANWERNLTPSIQRIADAVALCDDDTAPEVAPVKVAVHIEGGLIQGVIASAPVEWIAIDTEDFRTAEDDDKMAFAPDGELARLTGCPGCVHLACFEPASISPEAIKEIEE